MRAYARPATEQQAERDRRIAEHADMARRIALRVGRRVPAHLSEDDLVGAAMLGLAEAAERYDASRGEPFIAFAEKRVRGAVLDELRRGDLLPRRVRTQARKVGEAVRALEQRLGRPPEDVEVAAELGVTIEVYRDDLEQLTRTSFVELPEEGAELAGDPDELRSHHFASPAAHAERAELVERLSAGIERIDQRDQTVLSLYYLEELSYSEIGEVLGVSESRVCQLHARALARLRAEVGETGVRARG